MFARILVPIDQTARSDEALEAAARLARRTGAGLALVHVEEPVSDLARTAQAEQELTRRVAQLRAAGLDATSAVRFGRPEAAIADAIMDEAADLIVMAPHHRAGFEGLTHPSVTERMFSRARAPIFVWPEKAPGQALTAFLNVPGATAIVALDGSEAAERALPFAVAFAREYACPLLVVRAVAPVQPGVIGPETYQIQVERQSAQEREVRHYLSAVRQRLSDAVPTSVQSMVLQGLPERELLRLAETHEGSLLVLSTHGRTGLNRLLVGSVATSLMRATPLPLLVVPPDAPAPAVATAPSRAARA